MLPYPVCDDKYASFFMIFAHTDLLGPVLPELFGGSAFCRYLVARNGAYTKNIGIMRFKLKQLHQYLLHIITSGC